MNKNLTGQAKLHTLVDTFEHDSSLLKIQKVLPELHKNMMVLDVGCGDARLSSGLVSSVTEVVGLDIHESALLEAQKKGLKTISSDIETTWQINDKSIDLVLILDTLEHISDCEFILNEAKRVLKNDGSIIITIPNHFDLKNRLNILFGGGIIHWSNVQYGETSWKYSHIRFLNLIELKTLVDSVGLHSEITQLNFMGGGILPAKLVPKVIRLWLTRTYPNLFSGKFTMRLRLKNNNMQKSSIILDKTEIGM